jgi:hypothetical protein
VLRRYREPDIDEDIAGLLVPMSAATIDRRPALARSGLLLKGRSHGMSGSLLKSRIPMRTWADHDENTPGFVEIDLVGHEGGSKPLSESIPRIGNGRFSTTRRIAAKACTCGSRPWPTSC